MAKGTRPQANGGTKDTAKNWNDERCAQHDGTLSKINDSLINNVPEIKIALFGSRGSGKTTLLSSYFGNLQRYEFESLHGYHLEATDTTQGNELLSKYYKLERGEFPLGTERFSEFTFDFKVHELSEPCAKVTWFDYPGGWWESTPQDTEEIEVRKNALAKLMSSQVGMLLLDGDRYQIEGAPYIRQILDQFKNEIRKVRDSLNNMDKGHANIPGEWVIAISKADLLPEEETAESICKSIVSDALEQLNGIGSIFDGSEFGKQFLLLSSVRGQGSHVSDAHEYLGLQLIAPVALLSVLSQVAADSGKGAVYGPPIYIVKTLANILDLIDTADDFLPVKYQLITKFINALDLKKMLDESTDNLRARQAKAARKGKHVEAVISAMLAELSSDEANKTFYKNQH